MTDEVTRLRGLRKVALQARALGHVVRTQDDRRDSIFSRAALLCWRVSRLCSGRLYAHPYPAFQRGPSALETLSNGVDALVSGTVARRLGRRANRFYAALQLLSQTLDDVRALTLTPELSDDFGRAQARLRQLMSELSLRAHLERGIAPQQPPAGDLPTPAARAHSPYIAL